MAHDANGGLPPAVTGERRFLEGRAGRVGCYVAGRGAPLLLVHSINAAASAYEVRPIHEHFVPSRRVFSPDLPGFGCSERSERDYDVRLFVDAVHDVVDEIGREHGAAQVDALALSLSAEFLARAARERPERFRSLALVTPTGFDARSAGLREPEGSTREVPLVHRALTTGPVGGWLYGLLVRRGSIRYFLRRTFGSDAIDEGLASYAYLTTHQPGAERAPFAFLSGKLFSRDVRDVYESLRLPIWLPHGTRGDFQDFRGADWARADPRWTVQPFATGALPHFEEPEAFCAAYERFLAGVAEPAPPES